MAMGNLNTRECEFMEKMSDLYFEVCRLNAEVLMSLTAEAKKDPSVKETKRWQKEYNRTKNAYCKARDKGHEYLYQWGKLFREP